VRPADDRALVASVRAHYTERLEQGRCCGPIQVESVPVLGGVEMPSFGCGNPVGTSGLRAGETVLDLGSGAGLDAARAAAAVGPRGRVIGVDMTPAMLERSREAAGRLGIDNVEFREGMIEDLPVADASVDVVISNCVINLSVDKARVLREIERVLVPLGRMHVSDVLRSAHEATTTVAGWCACVDGALDAATYRLLARRAGLVDVAVHPASPVAGPDGTYSATVTARKALIRPASEADAAAAAASLAQAGLPVAGWHGPATRRWVLVEDDRVRGAIGLEVLGGAALVRSLVVDPDLRGRGFGGALLAVARREASRVATGSLFGITTTVSDWLTRLGFVETTRERLPAALFVSAELQGACPDSARVFALELDAPRPAAGP
jgi:arsenite methyltransferase